MGFAEKTLCFGLSCAPLLAGCGSGEGPADGSSPRAETSDLTVYSAVKVNKANGVKVYVHVMPWFESNSSSGNGRWGLHWTMAN